MMPQATMAQKPSARTNLTIETGAGIFRFRFVPPKHMNRVDIKSDHGLKRLLYLQFLVTDDVESGETVEAS